LSKENLMNPTAVRGAIAAVLLIPVLSGCDRTRAEGGPGGFGPPPVSVAPAVAREVQAFDEFTGRLEATETVDIRPRVAGALTQVHFREGQLVKRGDALFTIDPRPFAAEAARAEAQLAAARTQAQLAASEVARVQKLLDLKAISTQEYDQLTASSRSADSNLKAADAALTSARLNLEYAYIRAPISGRVSRANVTAGNLVSVGETVLTTIVSQDKVYAYFDASEQTYLKYVRAARDGTRPSSRESKNPVLMGLANEQGYPHKGAVDFVDNRLNPTTGAMRGRAVFDNSQGLFTPGLFARLKLIGSGSFNAVLTPDRAIGTDQDKRFVLVVGENNVAQFRPVKLGVVIDGMRVIESGLKAGELVVVNGLQRVQPGMLVTPQKLEVDGSGMPIEPPPAPPGAAPSGEGKAGEAKGGEAKGGDKGNGRDAKKPEAKK
jgi:RND family efflux transporter MFP subunit